MVIPNDSFGPFGRTGVAGNSHYYAYDPQGSPFLVLNDGSSPGTSSVLTTYEDDAFGNQAAGNTAVTPASDPYVDFGGEWGYRTDAATGLELLEHRYYDPAAGRFVTRDPVGYEGGMDLYAYCLNQPNERSDRFGEDWNINGPHLNKIGKTIWNINIEIQKRIGELRQDLQELKESDPQTDLVKPSLTRSGHRYLINMLKARRCQLQAELDNAIAQIKARAIEAKEQLNQTSGEVGEGAQQIGEYLEPIVDEGGQLIEEAPSLF